MLKHLTGASQEPDRFLSTIHDSALFVYPSPPFTSGICSSRGRFDYLIYLFIEQHISNRGGGGRDDPLDVCVDQKTLVFPRVIHLLALFFFSKTTCSAQNWVS